MLDAGLAAIEHTPGAVGADLDDLSLEEAFRRADQRMQVAGLRSRTRAEYASEAQRFADWFRIVRRREPRIGDLTVESVDAFLIARGAAAVPVRGPWSPATLRHFVRSFRAIGGHLADACALEGNPLRALRGPVHSRRTSAADLDAEIGERAVFDEGPGDGLIDEDVDDVIRSLRTAHPHDAITLGAFALGYEGGPRTSELVNLDVRDVGVATVRGVDLGPVVWIRRPAKTSHVRCVPLGVRAEDFIRAAIGARTDGPLFPARDGSRMTPRGLYSRLARAGARCGIDLSPQRLRRTAASWQAAYGASSGHLDAVFGWQPDPNDVKSAITPGRTSCN